MIQLPAKPWNEGDTFTNDATGVEYTFDGVKWLASGGEELDLSGFVTDAQLVAVEDASVVRDEVLDGKIDQESNLNTAAHLKIEDQIQWTNTHYQQGDQKLQDQIDELGANADEHVSKTGGDSMEGPLTITAQDSTQARATKRVETLGVFSNSEGSALRLGTTRDRVYVGHNDTAFNGPIKVGEIQEKTEDEGILLSNHAVLAEEGTEPNHLVTKGHVDSADQRLQGEIEQIALALESLLTAKTAGQWAYDGTIESGPPRTAGTFKALADMSATENRLALHMEDANGITHAFGDAEVGDYIEVVDMDDPKVYALYVLTEEPPISGTLVELPVKLKDRGADFEIGDSCTIRHFAVNQEDINLSELDDRYVEKSKGDQTMKGPLTISGLGTWKGSRLFTEFVTSESDAKKVQIGTPSNDANLAVYDDKVRVTDVPLQIKVLQEWNPDYGIKYEGAFTDPDHIATKKDLDAIGGGGDVDTSDLVKKSGDTMTGTLTAPRLEAKQESGEAVMLVEGKLANNNSAARLTFSNKQNTNAYGSLTFQGLNGNGWFQFNKDLDMSGKGIHSVTRVRLTGDKAIQDGTDNRILLNNKVTIPKAGDSNTAGFTIKGKTNGGNNDDLLSVYHNASGLDAVNYSGKQGAGSDNVATCKYVDDKVGSIGTSAGSLVSTSFGCKYYRLSNSNDFTFHAQDSNNAANSAHASTKYLTIKLPSDFWTVKAGVVPAGTDMGYITITAIGDGKVIFSGQVVSVSSGGATFKVDAKKDLWSSGTYTEGTSYLIRMESCFREA